MEYLILILIYVQFLLVQYFSLCKTVFFKEEEPRAFRKNLSIDKISKEQNLASKSKDALARSVAVERSYGAVYKRVCIGICGIILGGMLYSYTVIMGN